MPKAASEKNQPGLPCAQGAVKPQVPKQLGLEFDY